MNMDRWFSVSSTIIGFLVNRNEGLYDGIQDIMKWNEAVRFSFTTFLHQVQKLPVKWLLGTYMTRCIVQVLRSDHVILSTIIMQQYRFYPYSEALKKSLAPPLYYLVPSLGLAKGHHTESSSWACTQRDKGEEADLTA